MCGFFRMVFLFLFLFVFSLFVFCCCFSFACLFGFVGFFCGEGRDVALW